MSEKGVFVRMHFLVAGLICVPIVIFFDFIIHFSSCRLAKKLQKPICTCWDCPQKCDLYRTPKR